MIKKKYIFIIVGVFIIIFNLFSILFYIGLNSNSMSKRNESLLKTLKKSEVLKNEIGEIKSIDNKIFIFTHKYTKLDALSEYINYTIRTSDNKKHKIKVIYNKKYTLGIYAYEINGKIFYEDIEKVQIDIGYSAYIIYSRLLKEKFGNIKIANRKDSSSEFKEYGNDGSESCEYYIELENGKIIYLTVIINKKYTEGIYAYIIDGELIYENLNYDNLDYGIEYLNTIMYSDTLRNLVGNYVYIYELELSKREDTKNNQTIIDFILMKDEDNSKKISVIFDDDDTIYGYIVNGETICEKNCRSNK